MQTLIMLEMGLNGAPIAYGKLDVNDVRELQVIMFDVSFLTLLSSHIAHCVECAPVHAAICK